MRAYVLRRTLVLLPLMMGVSLVVFLALRLAPGDPAVLMLGESATQEGVAKIHRDLGLDRPLIEQYVRFVGASLRGDLGRSFSSGRPVAEEVVHAFRISLTLAVLSMLASSLLGMTMGCLSAVGHKTWTDYLVRSFVLGLVSMPVFWLGLLLASLLSVELGWLPASGWGTFKHTILPVLTLSAFPLASIARMTRSSVLEAMMADYVTTAKAKGVRRFRIIVGHVLPNALIPVTTVIGLQFGTLLGGAVLVESVFALPGLGTLLILAVLARDYAIIRGVVLFVALMFALVNLSVDVLYAYLDPRIHYS
jgi:peptide/nickel transport system permease protein